MQKGSGAPRQQHAAEHGWCEAPFYVAGERQLWRLGKAYLDSYAELPSKAEVAAGVRCPVWSWCI